MQTCRKSVMSIMSGVMPLLPISKKNDNSEGSVQNTVIQFVNKETLVALFLIGSAYFFSIDMI